MSYDNAAFEQLSAFLDGRLTPDEARAVQEQLEESEDYRALHEQISSAREVLRSTPSPDVPPGLLASIQAEARAEMARTAQVSIWQRWRAPLAAAAAAAAVLLAVFTPWQSFMREQQNAAVCPMIESPPAVAEAPADEPADAASADEQEPVEVAEAPAAESEAAVVGTVSRADRPERRVARASTSPAAPAEEAASATQPEEPAPAAEPVPEPMLASAPQSVDLAAATEGPVLSEPRRPMMLAMGPRTTVEDSPRLAPAAPSALEAEMATGVVAGMVLDQYVAEHMVESSATMLSVVTDMPTSELGPAIAEEEDETGSFGFSFTDAMRRALTESENDLP